MIFVLSFAMKQLVPNTISPGVAGAIIGSSEFCRCGRFCRGR